MKNKIDILKQEVEISDVVMNATEETFAKILKENKKVKEVRFEMTEAKRKKKFGKKWVAIAAVAVLAAGSLTAAAGAHFNWFSPVEEEMYITDAQKDALEKFALGTEVGDSETHNGVTITLEQIICDEHYFFAVLSVEGMDYPEAEQWIGFKEWDVDITCVGINRGTYGQYLGVDEETGKMLYLYEGDVREDNIVGQTMTITLNTPQIYRPHTEEELSFDEEPGPIIDNSVKSYEGEWTLTAVLEGSQEKIEVTFDSAPTGNPYITLDSVILSPLSIERATTHSDPEKMIADWDDPDNGGEYNDGFYGFLMEDGTIQRGTGGSGSGSFNKSMTGRIDKGGYGTIVDIDQIEALLFIDVTDTAKLMEIWDKADAGNATTDDFVVVPLETK